MITAAEAITIANENKPKGEAYQPFERDDNGTMLYRPTAKRIELDNYTEMVDEEFNEKLDEWYKSIKIKLNISNN